MGEPLVIEINQPDAAFEYGNSRFAIIVSSYNEMVTGKLRDGAIETLQDCQIPSEKIDVIQVPGAWELALGAKLALASQRYAGMVCLGAVIRGETTHDQHINRFVSNALGQLSLETGVPIGFGLLTCNSFEQAHDRSGGKVGNKGHEATAAMLEMVRLSHLMQQL